MPRNGTTLSVRSEMLSFHRFHPFLKVLQRNPVDPNIKKTSTKIPGSRPNVPAPEKSQPHRGTAWNFGWSGTLRLPFPVNRWSQSTRTAQWKIPPQSSRARRSWPCQSSPWQQKNSTIGEPSRGLISYCCPEVQIRRLQSGSFNDPIVSKVMKWNLTQFFQVLHWAAVNLKSNIITWVATQNCHDDCQFIQPTALSPSKKTWFGVWRSPSSDFGRPIPIVPCLVCYHCRLLHSLLPWNGWTKSEGHHLQSTHNEQQRWQEDLRLPSLKTIPDLFHIKTSVTVITPPFSLQKQPEAPPWGLRSAFLRKFDPCRGHPSPMHTQRHHRSPPRLRGLLNPPPPGANQKPLHWRCKVFARGEREREGQCVYIYIYWYLNWYILIRMTMFYILCKRM